MERKERLSVRETRAALIESGCELFLEPRTDWGLGRISLGDAIGRSEVSRASAYRAFADDKGEPQDAFRVAVLLEVISRTVIDTSIVGEVLSGLDPSEFGSDADGRAAELREVIRCWTNRNLESSLENDLVRAVDICRAVVGLSPEPDPDILDAIRHAIDRSRNEFVPYLEAMGGRYGVRPRQWTNFDQLQRIFIAVTAMAMVEWTLDETTRVMVRPTGPNGADREWSLSGTIIESICLLLIEPDPDADVPANLASWLA
jgi:hypothetical protein